LHSQHHHHCHRHHRHNPKNPSSTLLTSRPDPLSWSTVTRMTASLIHRTSLVMLMILPPPPPPLLLSLRKRRDRNLLVRGMGLRTRKVPVSRGMGMSKII
ncbi:hypothetical protein BGZ96_001025, partial [Linnemannia gamsii]